MNQPENKPEIRDPLEIQRVHDILTAVLTGQTPRVHFGREQKQVMWVVIGTLCWILKHAHNKALEESLAEIEEALANAGYSFDLRPHPPSTSLSA
jgi:hypothetical protein